MVEQKFGLVVTDVLRDGTPKRAVRNRRMFEVLAHLKLLIARVDNENKVGHSWPQTSFYDDIGHLPTIADLQHMKPKSKMIAVLAIPGVQLLDVSGPLDVFAEANVQAERAVYQPIVVGIASGPIQSSSGVRLVSDRVVSPQTRERFDTLLIAGSPKATTMQLGAPLLAWIKENAAAARRYGSVCSGAFFLAAAGLLDGKRATTHWAVAEELAERFPKVKLEQDAIHIRDGKLRTAAGVTAGLDLALSLVEEDLGQDIALRVASQLVMFFKRPGGQMQFVRRGKVAPAGRASLQQLQRWVSAHPMKDHSVTSLAERLGMSPRHFARLFKQEVGATPAAWVESARIVAARAQLEQGLPPKQAAANCGFMDVDTFRRAFSRNVGVTPSDYRRRFALREERTFSPARVTSV